jgi:hypothetical protein
MHRLLALIVEPYETVLKAELILPEEINRIRLSGYTRWEPVFRISYVRCDMGYVACRPSVLRLPREIEAILY